jgi:U3 small nucleolar RNA-associated protein 24
MKPKKKTNFLDKHKKMITMKAIEKSKDWNKHKNLLPNKKDEEKLVSLIKHKEAPTTQMFLSYNTALVPPYRILVDTNFINFSIQNKLDIIKTAMDCLYSKVVICITDCVMAELEKLGERFRVALRVAKDPRFERLKCLHKGTYADDCICNRIESHNVYIVATCDKDLKRRIRKVPGVPIMFLKGHRYTIERLPDIDQMGAPRL